MKKDNGMPIVLRVGIILLIVMVFIQFIQIIQKQQQKENEELECFNEIAKDYCESINAKFLGVGNYELNIQYFYCETELMDRKVSPSDNIGKYYFYQDEKDRCNR